MARLFEAVPKTCIEHTLTCAHIHTGHPTLPLQETSPRVSLILVYCFADTQVTCSNDRFHPSM